MKKDNDYLVRNRITGNEVTIQGHNLESAQVRNGLNRNLWLEVKPPKEDQEAPETE